VNFSPRVAGSNNYSTDRYQSFIPELGAANFAVESLRGDKAKRLVDLCLSVLSLPAVLICALPIALLIALQGGNPIYKHLRVGRSGQLFHCYKFRTMVADAGNRLRTLLREDPQARREWFEHFKLENDPRVTRLGWFLRKTSLDELPQIWNVLRGEMSWVGPRPIIPDEMDKYGTRLPAYLACRPGITGLWQVNGRSDTTYAERIAFDVQYAERRSILLDLKILLLTIPRILTAKGSY
jgi:exopolysaccharide production protein ExoY